MLVYATKFPLSESTIQSDILDLSIEWLCASRHNNWKNEDIEYDIKSNSIKKIECYGQAVKLGCLTNEAGQLAAFKHSWTSRDSLEWETEITCLFKQGTPPVVCIRLHCSTNLAGMQIPQVKKPVLVGLLLDKLGGGNDGIFTVGDKPHELDDIDVAADIVNGNTRSDLPVVYVSSDDNSNAYVDHAVLARQLSGLAHVVVEPSRSFSFELREKSNGRNTYAGAVGVYWSSGAGLHARYLPSNFRPGDLEKTIVSDIAKITCESRIDTELTWSAVQLSESRSRLEALRSTESHDVVEWMDAFGGELEAKDDELSAANREVARLQSQLMRIQSSVHLGGGLLKPGNEKDLYADEHMQIIIEALQNQLERSRDYSRAKDVLTDLLQANPVVDTRSGFIQELKKNLSTGGKIGNRQIELLEDMGFDVTSDGKHHKAVFAQDNRYQFTLPKTASDHRAGKNIVSEITGKLFK